MQSIMDCLKINSVKTAILYPVYRMALFKGKVMKKLLIVLIMFFSSLVSATDYKICETGSNIVLEMYNNKQRGVPKEYYLEALKDSPRYKYGDGIFKYIVDNVSFEYMVKVVYRKDLPINGYELKKLFLETCLEN